MPAMTASPATPFRLHCLGPGALTRPDGSRVELRTRKHIALLLLMARRGGRAVPRDWLVEMLWSEDDETKARHSLSQAVSLVNKTAGAEIIVPAGHNQLALAAGSLELDAVEFEQLADKGRHADARPRWRGPLLDGVWIRRAPNFDRWLAEERQRLGHVLRRVAQELVEQRRKEGDHAAMRAEAELLLDADPLDENAMLAWLEAVSLAGDRTLALRRYAEFEVRLKDELGAEPGTKLQAWARRYRKADAEAIPPQLLSRVRDTMTLPAVQPLFGRVDEFKQLWESWQRAQEGHGSFWIIEGEAGIGKTALVGKIANQAHAEGASVCYVKCYRTEKSVPFAPISALIRQLSRLPGFLAISPSWLGELTRLVPELRERHPNAPAPLGVDDSARLRLCDATVSAAQCVSDEQPLMVVVDDIHDADDATLALLHFHGRQCADRPLLLLTTARPIDVSQERLRTFRQTATACGIAQALVLAPLGEAEVGRLILSVAATRGATLNEARIQHIVGSARGNPLDATEAVFTAIGAGAPSTRKAVLGAKEFEETASARFLELVSQARLVAAAVMVVGRPVSEYEITGITRITAASVASHTIALENAGLLKRLDGRLAIAHERYGEPLMTGISADERRRLHRAVADVLVPASEGQPSLHLEIARHYEASGVVDAAVSHAMRAAEYAASVGAKRVQREALELARDTGAMLSEDVVLTLAECYEELEETAKLEDLIEDLRRKQTLCASGWKSLGYLRASAQWKRGTRSAVQVMDCLLTTLASPEDFRHRSRAELLLMRVADKVQAYSVVRQSAKRLRHGPASGRQLSAEALFATAYVACKYYAPRHSIALIHRALRIAEDTNNWWLEPQLRDVLGIALKLLGRYRDSIVEFETALGLSRRTMNPQAEVAALHNRAVSEMALGWLEQAEATHREAEKFEDLGSWAFAVIRQYNHAIIQYYRGAFESASRSFEESAKQCERVGFALLGANSYAGLVLCHHRMENPLAMRAAHAQMLRLDPNLDEMTNDWIRAAAAAWIEVRQGDGSEALRKLRRACSRMRHRDVSYWLALEAERLLVEESLAGHRLAGPRSTLTALAERYEAGLILHALTQ